MRIDRHRWATRATIALITAMIGIATGLPDGTVRAGASGVPTAGFSMNPADGPLTVQYVADSSGFPATVVSYLWNFGDGHSTTTTARMVTHTYPSATTFAPTLTETDAQGHMATATGTIGLFECPVGTAMCSESLTNAGAVQLVQASGPISPSGPASVRLLAAPYRIPNCERAIATAVGITDAGFTGDLTVTFKYTTSHPQQVQTTCFSSTVPFVDAAGQTVHNGALPSCPASGGVAPCVQSISVTGAQVTKVLSVPPGDPKVGGP